MRIFFVVLGIFLTTFAKVSTLSCDVGEGKDYCKISKQGFLWSEEKEIPVEKLKGAKVTVGGRDADSLTYQVVLVTNNGEIQFSPNSSFSDKKQQNDISNRINSYARNTNKAAFNISADDRWWGLAGTISLVIGFYPLILERLKKN